MPSSAAALISPVMGLVCALRPKSVLDVGCGLGKFGALCREYLDWWGAADGLGTRRTRIDAVEAWAAYIGPLHRVVYDEIHAPVDAVDFLEADGGERYDLILCCDVIEHFDRERGERFLAAAMKRCRTLIVTTPEEPLAQGAVFGNEHERHRSAWVPADFARHGSTRYWSVGNCWLVMVEAVTDGASA